MEQFSLEKTFQTVNYWLEFGEKKNTQILSLFSILTVLSPLIAGGRTSSLAAKILLFSFYVLYLFTLVTAVIALIPRTKPQRHSSKPQVEDNLLYYGNICYYTTESYQKAINERYSVTTGKSNFSNDLLGQIVQNSYIAVKKMHCAKASFISFLVSLVLLSAILILNIC